MQIIVQVEKRKEHKSHWAEERESAEVENPMEYADSQEISCDGGLSLDANPEDIAIESIEC